MPKFGEFNSARLKPTWEDTSRPARDATGWKRGGRSWNDGESKFMRTANPKADREFYGPTTNQGRRDGAMRDLATLEAEKELRHTTNRLAYYAPYKKQQDFHAAGAKYRERICCAGNQLGKTTAGSFEVAYHATGRYPDDWKGKRFDRPTVGWACGVSGEVVKDTVQRLLVGRPGSLGTGAIPKDAIIETVTARGIADLLATIKVQHVSGGVSIDRLEIIPRRPRGLSGRDARLLLV